MPVFLSRWWILVALGAAWTAVETIKPAPPDGMFCACTLCPNKTCFTDGVCLSQVFRQPDGLVLQRESCLSKNQLFPPENPLLCLGPANRRESSVIVCCSDYDYCNRDSNLTLAVPVTTTPVSAHTALGLDENHRLMVIGAGVVVSVLFLIAIGMGVFYCRRTHKLREKSCSREEGAGLLESGLGSGEGLRSLIDEFSVTSGSGSGLPVLIQRTVARQVTLIQQIGKGRYGEVYLGKWRGESIAVKMFSSRDENSWKREVEIYQTMMLRHENLLGFIAADNKDNGMTTQLWLVMEYHELGSLYDYLTKTVIDIPALLRLSFSLANGLAHLHMDIVGNSASGKPAIAHRDLKSRNVLVKRNGQCAIADLGLAVAYYGQTGTVDIPNNEKVGTVRYLAPEILDGNLNVKNFESLKSADVYAMGLVLWEICHRCQFCGVAEEYELPYANDVPNDPDLHHMKDVVCVQKKRPCIHNQWSSREPMNTMCRILRECWSHHPGARLTALRVKKTIAQLIATEDVKL